MNGKINRLVSIDYIRAFAIICVILTHSVEWVYTLNLDSVRTYSILRRLYAFSLFTIGRMGVPLFFFISGYLLLDRVYDFDRAKTFYRRNLLGIIMTVEVWIVIYNIFNAIYYDTAFSVGELWRNMLFLKATNMSHMWYMPVIIGIYLFIQLIANMLHSIDIRMLALPFSIAWLCIFVVPEIDLILQWRGHQPIAAQPDMSFSGGCYGIYLIAGYLAKKGVFDRLSPVALTLSGISGFVATVLIQLLSYHYGIGYNVWYNNATLFITAMSILLIGLKFLQNGLGPADRAVTSLAKCSFGIYLIHNPIVMCLLRAIVTPYNSIKTIVLFILTLAISWAVVWAIGRNKVLARVMVNMKG